MVRVTVRGMAIVDAQVICDRNMIAVLRKVLASLMIEVTVATVTGCEVLKTVAKEVVREVTRKMLVDTSVDDDSMLS